MLWSELATGSLVHVLGRCKAAPLAWMEFRWLTSGQNVVLWFYKLLDPASVLVNECKALLKFTSGTASKNFLQRITNVLGPYPVHADMQMQSSSGMLFLGFRPAHRFLLGLWGALKVTLEFAEPVRLHEEWILKELWFTAKLHIPKMRNMCVLSVCPITQIGATIGSLFKYYLRSIISKIKYVQFL